MRAAVLAFLVFGCAAPAGPPAAASSGLPLPAASVSEHVPVPVPEHGPVDEHEHVHVDAHEIPAADAAGLLFSDATSRGEVSACLAGAAPIPCLLRLRYAADEQAQRAAVAFFEKTGCVAGLEKEQMFDGGWRGTIRLVPELPVGAHRRHLVDAAAAVEGLDALIVEIGRRASKPVTYRARDIAFRFLRSVGRTTPSAFAEKWSIGYNVSGSLLGTAKGVRETLVHEIFHLNDEGRGPAGGAWSAGALQADFDAIVARCGTRSACLAPFAPGDTMVRGGTYYAFQPGGGVHEYAAELAVRYVRETEAALGKGPAVARPFRCGPPENARSWRALADAFFGGLDLSPTCDH